LLALCRSSLSKLHHVMKVNFAQCVIIIISELFDNYFPATLVHRKDAYNFIEKFSYAPVIYSKTNDSKPWQVSARIEDVKKWCAQNTDIAPSREELFFLKDIKMHNYSYEVNVE